MSKNNIRLCIISPNKDAVSETFIKAHIDRLPFERFCLYGRDFHYFDSEDRYISPGFMNKVKFFVQRKLKLKSFRNQRPEIFKEFLRKTNEN